MAHRLFHDEGDATVQQRMRDLRHLVMTSQAHHEVGLLRIQHGVIVGVSCDATPKLADAVGSDGGVLIMQRDDLDVIHGQQLGQVGVVIEGVPVGNTNGSNTNGHKQPNPRFQDARRLA